MRIIIGIGLVLSMTATAWAGEWTLLGTRAVGLAKDKDAILVTAMRGDFKKIRLKVRRNGVHIIDVWVHYANGDVQDVAVKTFIKAGGQTRAIDLKGKSRVIKKVVFRYKSRRKSGKGQAIVELWASD